MSLPTDYEEIPTGDGNFIIRIPTLGPKELVTVQVLSYAQPFALLNVRSSAGAAEAINFQIQRVFPMWSRALVGLFMLTGFGFTAYWLIRAISSSLRESGLVDQSDSPESLKTPRTPVEKEQSEV